MTPDLDKLAHRAVACKHWRWMQGMAVMRKEADTLFDADSGMSFAISEIRVTAAAFEVCEPQDRFVDVSTLLNDKTRSVGQMFLKDLLPDLSDPATLGCLLALVREAWNDPTLGLFAVRGGRSGRPASVWAFGGRKPRRKGWDKSIASAFFGSEAAALVFGLEAAK
jgi:hypothetical protein